MLSRRNSHSRSRPGSCFSLSLWVAAQTPHSQARHLGCSQASHRHADQCATHCPCEVLRPHWDQVKELSSGQFTLISLLNHGAQCWFSFAFCLFSSQFCEVITLSWLQHLSGKVVRVMLDYVDQVQICSKLKAVLEKQNLWPEIHVILSEYRS